MCEIILSVSRPSATTTQLCSLLISSPENYMNTAKLTSITLLTLMMLFLGGNPAYAQDQRSSNPDAADIKPECGAPVYASDDGGIDRVFLVDTSQNKDYTHGFAIIRTFNNSTGNFVNYPVMCLPLALTRGQIFGDKPVKKNALIGYKSTEQKELPRVLLPTASMP